MPGVFVSYRRRDEPFAVGALVDHLRSTLGEGAVFHDVDSVAGGHDYRVAVHDRLLRADVVLAVIGPQWNAGAQLDDPDDDVRLELETAMAAGRPVIPVLVGGRTMPGRSEVPSSLVALVTRNAVELRPPPDLDADLGRILDAILAFRPLRLWISVGRIRAFFGSFAITLDGTVLCTGRVARGGDCGPYDLRPGEHVITATVSGGGLNRTTSEKLTFRDLGDHTLLVAYQRARATFTFEMRPGR